ncbi:MAG TPA: hypothetical protein VFP22_10435, partial [Candidatus Limnocylindrales bacterium]|nr:hypothetical protein [Candidatus Limnocylindrales bacterium]
MAGSGGVPRALGATRRGVGGLSSRRWGGRRDPSRTLRRHGFLGGDWVDDHRSAGRRHRHRS